MKKFIILWPEFLLYYELSVVELNVVCFTKNSGFDYYFLSKDILVAA